MATKKKERLLGAKAKKTGKKAPAKRAKKLRRKRLRKIARIKYKEVEGEPIVYHGIDLKPCVATMGGKTMKRSGKRYRGSKYGWEFSLIDMTGSARRSRRVKERPWQANASRPRTKGGWIVLRGSGKTAAMALRGIFTDLKAAQRELAVVQTQLAVFRTKLESSK
jgi:hypothetical protein